MNPTRSVPYRLGICCVLLVPMLVAPAPVRGQQPVSVETTERVRQVHAAVSATGEALGDDLWPDFDPEAHPVLYSGLDQAVLMGWPGELPDGFESVQGLEGAGRSPAPPYGALMGQGTTFTSLDPSYGLAAATALAVHEHFHMHQREATARGEPFGRGERPRDVRLYPAFDTTNAALLALEGRLLGAALRPGVDPDLLHRRVREFLVVRERRRSRLEPEVRAWERGTERNEGLAAYVAHRTLGWLVASDYRGWGKEAASEVEGRISRLERLTEVSEGSLRRVFYVTGSAQALLLDRLDPRWKDRMASGDETLEGLLAATVDEGPSSPSGLFRRVARRERLTRLRGGVATNLARLAQRRRVEVEGVRTLPGLRVVLHADDGAQVCGLDPLNVLHAPDRSVVHPGFVRLCSEGGEFSATFTARTLERVDEGIFTVPVGPPDEVVVEVEGSEISLEDLGVGGEPNAGRIVRRLEIRSPGLSLTAERARIRTDGGALVVQPIRPERPPEPEEAG